MPSRCEICGHEGALGDEVYVYEVSGSLFGAHKRRELCVEAFACFERITVAILHRLAEDHHDTLAVSAGVQQEGSAN